MKKLLFTALLISIFALQAHGRERVSEEREGEVKAEILNQLETMCFINRGECKPVLDEEARYEWSTLYFDERNEVIYDTLKSTGASEAQLEQFDEGYIVTFKRFVPSGRAIHTQMSPSGRAIHTQMSQSRLRALTQPDGSLRVISTDGFFKRQD